MLLKTLAINEFTGKTKKEKKEKKKGSQSAIVQKMANAKICPYYTVDILNALITVQWLLPAQHKGNSQGWQIPPNPQMHLSYMLMMVSLILVEVCRGSDGKQSASVSKSVSHHVLKHKIRILQMIGSRASLDLGVSNCGFNSVNLARLSLRRLPANSDAVENPKALVGTRRQVYPSCPPMPRDLVRRDYLSFKYKTSVIP